MATFVWPLAIQAMAEVGVDVSDWSFPDPPQAVGTEEECLAVFRQVRDAIGARIQEYIVYT